MKWIDLIINGLVISGVFTLSAAIALFIVIAIGYVLLMVETVYLCITLIIIWLIGSILIIVSERYYETHIDEREEDDYDEPPFDL